MFTSTLSIIVKGVYFVSNSFGRRRESLSLYHSVYEQHRQSELPLTGICNALSGRA